MKILFLGTLYRQDEEKYLLQKSKTGLQSQANTFQWALINGLDSVLKKPVDIINVLPVGTYPIQFTDLILKSRKWAHKSDSNDQEIGSINLTFLKQIIRTVMCKLAIKKWIKENNIEDELCIVIYTNYLPFLKAVKNVSNKVQVTLIVTDLPEYDDLTSSINFIKKLLRSLNNKLIYESLNRINSFVILTEQMKERLSIGTRPYVVVEGLVDSKIGTNISNEIIISNKKVILYTGTLTFKLGITNLLNVFSLIDNLDYELWICGAGEAEKEIIKKSVSDSRIKYMGYVSKKEIYDLQQQATVLINPRMNNGEYTKYSFPSKTMEYMLSGRPVLMYKLDGVPDEYDQYLYNIDGNEPKDTANRIVEICEKPRSELHGFGQKAKQFVLENKNCKMQAKKIIDMIKYF